MLDWLGRWHIGDFASILGLLASAISIVAASTAARRAQTASERADAAAKAATAMLLKSAAIASCSQALSIMDEIKRLHRARVNVAMLPDRYNALRLTLLSIKDAEPDLTVDQRTAIQAAIGHFTAMEIVAEEALRKKTESIDDFPRINRIVSQQMEAIHEILVSVQSGLRKVGNGG